MFFKKNKLLKISGVFLCGFLISSCGENPDVLLDSAKKYISKQEYKTALIQIKNALQINPKIAEGRFLMGSALLEEGDAAGAETEFRKALDLKYPQDSVIPLLAKALLVQGNAKKLTDELGQAVLSDPRANASLLMSLTSAYEIQGDSDKSKNSHDSALRIDPENVPARLLNARKKLIEGEPRLALDLVEKIILEKNDSFDAWKLKGDILLADKNKIQETLAAYRKAIEIKPNLLSAHTTLIALLFQQKDNLAAEIQLKALKKYFPDHLQTKFFEGQLAFNKKDYKLAKSFLQQVLLAAPLNAQALQLAGVIEFQLGAFSQAELYLTKLIKEAPDLILPRRVLIQIYLRSGQFAKAQSTLQYLIDKETLDSEMFSLAGEVYLQNGNMKLAEYYFKKSANTFPDDQQKKTILALTHLMSGSVDVAIDELKNISVLDNGSSADLALYNFYINKKDFDKALDVVGILDKKMPGKPLPPHLQGRTLLAKNDLSGAAKSFERAAAIDPSFFPAISSLAALDRLAGRPELAKSRYESFLSKSPKNVQAWLELVDMALKTGSSKDDISKLIAKAIASNPEDVKTRLFQIEFYLKAKDIKAAGIAAQNSVSALPGSAELLDALGRTQIAAGDFNQALLTYQKLASQDVNSYLPHIRLADVYAVTKNKEAAIQSLQRALELKSDFRPAQRSLIFIDVKDKNYSRALSMAKIIQQQSPKDEEGFALEADIFASQNKWPEALAALQSGMKQVNSPVLSFKQYYFLYGTGKVTEAEKLSEKWQKENPKDSIFLFYLGDAYLTRNDFKGAEKIYLSLLNLKSENAVVYNNLAWVLDKLKKPGAIHYAEKANKLLPNNPAFMDTLAQIYNNSDSFEKAVDWQLKALLLDPSNTVFKLNLAKIYVKSGKNDLARKQLEELRALGNNFPSYAEVLNLLKTV